MRTRPLLRLVGATLLLAFGDGTSDAAAQEITLVAAGDIEWSRAVKPPAAYSHQPTDTVVVDVRGEPSPEPWTSVPLLNLPGNRERIEQRLGRELDSPDSHHVAAIQYGLQFRSVEEETRYPFRQMRDVFQGADIAFANLEMPSRSAHGTRARSAARRLLLTRFAGPVSMSFPRRTTTHSMPARKGFWIR